MALSLSFDQFDTFEIETKETRIFARRGGAGPGLLLLHGFPQTHLMWRHIAPALAQSFTVVCADLRGCGRSGCPPSRPDHAAYAKCAMARDLVAMMSQLGFERFSIAGHDRGGRVTYRLAPDHPDRMQRLAVLDVVTTADSWERADARFAQSFWPWSLLAQPEPMPEQLIAAAPDAVVDAALSGWGTPAETFNAETRTAYVNALRNPAHIHAICEEYRAATTADVDHDCADRDAGRRITCPMLILWSGRGPLNSWYEAEGGPLALWRDWAHDIQGHPVDGGHFFPEEVPGLTIHLLSGFFGARPNGRPDDLSAGPAGLTI